MSTYNYDCPTNEGCTFEFPIKLNIPVIINPTLAIKPVPSTKENLDVYLETNVHLSPKVDANQPDCNPCLLENGHHKRQLPAGEGTKVFS